MKYKCWVGNLDGRLAGLVITTSQKKAIAVIETTMHDFKNYWGQAEKVPENLLADVLYIRPMISNGQWIPKKRCRDA